VSVPCPRCGRVFDEARFAFGRTLHCACGARVGPPVAPDAPGGGEPRFAADAMLGRLARWLRLLGFDSTWEADVPDERLVRQALADERWILTRDRALPVEWRVPRVYLVAAEQPFEQLREVVRAFGLGPLVRAFARCSRCNAALAPLAAEETAARVPLRVRERHARFLACPACGRVYWEGTHVERMRRLLERVLEPTQPGV
jgi:uncharacterized protein with PIN domain